MNNIYNTGGYGQYRVGGPRRHIPKWATRKYFLGGLAGIAGGGLGAAAKLAGKKGLGSLFRGGGYYQGGGMYGSNSPVDVSGGAYDMQGRGADNQATQALLNDSTWQNQFWNEQSKKEAVNQQMTTAATDAMSSLGAQGSGLASGLGGAAGAIGQYMQTMGGDNDPTTLTGKEKMGAGLSGAGSGAAMGAQMGSMLGPVGTGVGAVVGGIAGLIGGKKKAEKAQAEAKKELGKRNVGLLSSVNRAHADRMSNIESMGDSGRRFGGYYQRGGARMAYPMAKGGLQMGGFGPPMRLKSGGLSPMSYPANFSTGGAPANHSEGGYYQKGGWSTGEMYSRSGEKPILSSIEKGQRESGDFMVNQVAPAMKEAWQSDMSLGDKIQLAADVASFAPNPFIAGPAMATSSAISAGRGVRDISQGNYAQGFKQIGQAGLGVVPIASQLSKADKLNKVIKTANMVDKIADANKVVAPISKTNKILKHTTGDKSLIQQTANNMQTNANNQRLLAVQDTKGPMPSPADVKKTLGPVNKPDLKAPQSTIPKIQHKAPIGPKMPPKSPSTPGPIKTSKPVAGPKNKPAAGPKKGPSKPSGTPKKPLITKKAPSGGGGSGPKKPLIKPKLPLTKKPSGGGGGGKGPLAGLTTKKPGGGGGGGKPKIGLPKIGGGSGGKLKILPKGPGGGGGKGGGLAKLKLPKVGGGGKGGGGGLKLPKIGGGGGGGGGLAALKDKVTGKAQLGGFHMNLGSRIMGPAYDKEFRQKDRALRKEWHDKQKKERKEARADRKERRRLRKKGRQERRALRKSQRKDRRAARRGKYQDGGYSDAQHEYNMTRLSGISNLFNRQMMNAQMSDMENRIIKAEQENVKSKLHRDGGRRQARKEDKEWAMYAKMLNQLPEESKDKAASWMYIYDAKGRPVLPGQVPMITPGMIKKNLEKNQWLRMRYEGWRDDRAPLSLKGLLPTTKKKRKK